MDTVESIKKGKTALGIEFGSTRIKAVLVDGRNVPIASGSHDWENRFENGLWTYSLEDVLAGLQDVYAKLKRDVSEKYGVTLKKIGAIGVSAMMHGYLVFDRKDKLLVPFRTWRNNNAAPAAKQLSELFHYNIPARWSAAHLFQAVIDKEPHVRDIAFQTTLEGYVHWLLTGEKVIGVGEASGMFPVDPATKRFDEKMLKQFNGLLSKHGAPIKAEEIFPKILLAGEKAGHLTEEGAKLLDPDGDLESGIPFCPPEGDAGTGMAATNSVKPRTGNVSAGTSVFAMIVLEKELSKPYPEIDLVTTPSGDPVGMVHCNNCTSDLNAWVNVFGEFASLAGLEISKGELYDLLFFEGEKGKKDCGGLVSYNYVSGENITDIDAGRPLLLRTPESEFTLQNLMRANLYSAFATLKAGCDIMLKEEGVRLDRITGHGGIFKTERVAQSMLAAALKVPVTLMKTAGEGGAWGMALLANYLICKKQGQTLAGYLEEEAFAGQDGVTLAPDPEDEKGFEQYTERFLAGLPVVREAVKCIK